MRIWGDQWRRWRTDKHGQREALDLVQVKSALALRQVPKTEWPEIIDGLLVMEDEAIGIWTDE